MSWTTPRFEPFARGLKDDCDRLGYHYENICLKSEFDRIEDAWFKKIELLDRALVSNEQLIFLDAESRILRPIPNEWSNGQLWVAEKAYPKRDVMDCLRPFNTGFLSISRQHQPLVKSWLKIAEVYLKRSLAGTPSLRQKMGNEFSFFPALILSDFDFQVVQIDYVRNQTNGMAPLIRGSWQNDFTVIQHPFIHQWPNCTDLHWCKYILKCHFQSFEKLWMVRDLMDDATVEDFEMEGWFFSPRKALYSPQEFWPLKAKKWLIERQYF